MNLREKLRMFVLTKEEQRTVAFVVLTLVLGLATKHYRATHPPVATPNEHVQPTAAPTRSHSG